MTAEPHAADEPQPGNVQPVTWCFAMDHLAGEDHTIARPAGYDTQRGQLSLEAPDPRTNCPVARSFRPNPDDDPTEVGPDLTDPEGDRDLWRFRRIAARNHFLPGAYPSDITLVNWPQNDHPGGPPYDGARELSLSLLYWLQTEAPRPDGGTGWPGLRLRGDVLSTLDGLAKAAYIRESRRIVAEYTVVEQDIALDVRGDAGAVPYPDSVGVGHYRIDLHPSAGGDPYLDIGCCPFQVPLGALLPVRVENLLPAAKNIGTTHITNGAYRLHPVEWNIGEAAGHLVAHCTEHGLVPRQVRADADRLARFQHDLSRAGVELSWPQVRGY